jgi:hypothetical protein
MSFREAQDGREPIMNSERANFGKEKHQNALHPRSIRAPFLGQSWTMSDNEIENWSE